MINIPKTKEELLQLIQDGVEENLHLEYKSADALENTDGKKKEIAKDIGAMANSDGGVLIYGVQESSEADRRHLPDKITPIDRTIFSKEWLEQIILSNISPRIDGLKIHVITLDKPNDAVYLVEVPQSTTVHQNTRDHRYYYRRNFLVEPMFDYQIRDVLNRGKHPIIEIEFLIEKHISKRIPHPMLPDFPGLRNREPENNLISTYYLNVFPSNSGQILAQYINFFVYLPHTILDEDEVTGLIPGPDGAVEIYGSNTVRDIIDFVSNTFGGSTPKYGPSRYDPILPGTRGRSKTIKLANNFVRDQTPIGWTIYADNAPFRNGIIHLNEINVVEKII